MLMFNASAIYDTTNSKLLVPSEGACSGRLRDRRPTTLLVRSAKFRMSKSYLEIVVPIKLQMVLRRQINQILNRIIHSELYCKLLVLSCDLTS